MILISHGPSRAQEPAHSEVVACNNGAETINVVIRHPYPVEPGKIIVRGWYPVSPGECKSLDVIPPGIFHLYAEKVDSKSEWTGTAAFACLARRAMERIVFKDEKCLIGEARKGFFEYRTDPAKTVVEFR